MKTTASLEEPVRFAAGRGMFFLLGMAVMGLWQATLPPFHSSASSKAGEIIADGRTNQPVALAKGECKPWGDIEYTKLPLDEPDEFLPETTKPLGAPRWFFPNRSRQQVVKLLDSVQLSREQKQSLLEAKLWQSVSNGIYLSPPAEIVLEIGPKARERLYSVLAEDPLNSAQYHPFRFRPEEFETWLKDTGLGHEQLDLLEKLIYHQDGSICFCDGAIVQRLFSEDDFKRLVRALYRETTFIMRLRVTPQTDFGRIFRYWGQTEHAQTLRPVIESLAQANGGSIGISRLLPPFARLRLYSYADPDDPNAAAQNCFWTAMNFFRAKPDNRFLDFTNVQRVLKSDYDEVDGPPIYGDIISVRDASDTPVHMCVYLADNVVFTKNGHDHIEPWVLMKMPDMLARYPAAKRGRVAIHRVKVKSG